MRESSRNGQRRRCSGHWVSFTERGQEFCVFLAMDNGSPTPPSNYRWLLLTSGQALVLLMTLNEFFLTKDLVQANGKVLTCYFRSRPCTWEPTTNLAGNPTSSAGRAMSLAMGLTSSPGSRRLRQVAVGISMMSSTGWQSVLTSSCDLRTGQAEGVESLRDRRTRGY